MNGEKLPKYIRMATGARVTTLHKGHIRFQEIADRLNSFEWWTFIIGNDATVFGKSVMKMLTEGGAMHVLEVPNGCVLFVAKKDLPAHRIKRWLKAREAMLGAPAAVAANPDACSDVLLPMSAMSYKIADYLMENLPPIQGGYGKNPSNGAR
jgi:hypothetical protein